MSQRRREKVEDILPLHQHDKRHEPYKPRKGGRLDIIIQLQSMLMSIRWKGILILLIIWLFAIQYFERLTVKRSMSKCKWENWENWDKSASTHRIALIADPQIVDDSSYSDRPSILNYFVKKISDNYLHRNYRFMQEYLDPDTTIFLGDLFDGGRDWQDKMWLDEYKRFNEVFPKKINRRVVESLPGNHDIGFESIDLEVVKRFSAFFGEANDVIQIGNHSIILLDTISLSSGDSNVNKESKEFLNSLDSRLNTHFPRILLTHVPLYRFNDKQLCGPLRESKNLFPVQKGKQYQTVIDFEISQEILSVVKPDIVFSGDDHDYCDVQYSYKYNGIDRPVREITVKSASMTCGIKKPAIQLLSLHNPYNSNTQIESQDKFVTEMCYLPKPYFALKLYVFLFICSLIILGSIFFKSFRSFHKFEQLMAKRNDDFNPNNNKWMPLKVFVMEDKQRENDIGGFILSGLFLTFSIYVILGMYYAAI